MHGIFMRPTPSRTPRLHENTNKPSTEKATKRPSNIHFAPPLAAYRADKCGFDPYIAHFNSAKQLAALRGESEVPELSPQTVERAQTLQNLVATGYSTIVPVGVGKTMAKIDYDAEMGTAETALTTQNEHPISTADRSHDDVVPDLPAESRDLDADIADADSNDSDEGIFSNGDLSDSGFLAANANVYSRGSENLAFDTLLVSVGTLGTLGSVLDTAQTVAHLASTEAHECSDDVDMTFEES